MKFGYSAFLASMMAGAATAQTIVETAIATPALSTLVDILVQPGYEPVLNALNSPGNYTVFAPTNDAFRAAGIDATFARENVATVSNALLYHTLGATVPSGALAPFQVVETLQTNTPFSNLGEGVGQNIAVTADATGVSVSWSLGTQSNVVIPDVNCDNGVVHVVDTVIFPFPEDVVSVASQAGLTELIDAVVAAGLADAVLNTPGITIFAPTNEALQRANWRSLTTAQLQQVLTYHVVPAVAFSTDLSDGMDVPTLNGQELKVGINGGRVSINDANVAIANVLIQNGAVHVIDSVLLPELNEMVAADLTIVETAIATPALSTLVDILVQPGFEPILTALNSPGTFTVFAPTNDAFAAAGIDAAFARANVELTSQVLYYHVLGATVPSGALAPLQFPQSLMSSREYSTLPDGEAQRLTVSADANGVIVNPGNAQVVIADVDCTNGVVHVVDNVIFPFPADVVEVALGAGLTELVDAVVAAGLADAILSTPGITIFAPTNEALQAVNWRSLDIPTLTAVLTYHVVPALAFSTDLSNGMTVPTLNGGTLRVDLASAPGRVLINDATVIAANVQIDNGAVHVIDRVMLPTSL